MKPKISAVPSLRNRNSVMDANREKELAELKDSIKKAEARRQMYEESKHLDMAMKIQDEIIILQHRLEEKEKQGESQPPESRKFCSCMAK